MLGGEYYHYVYKPSSHTSAPKGYKPFYISHYGRHGSRYHSSKLYFDGTMTPLLKADSLGILAPKGKELLADITKLLKMHEGHFAQLSELGMDEQRAIAERLYHRFPSVFSGREGRDTMICLSSVYPRCLSSMANFLSSLQQYSSSQVCARMYCGDDIQQIVAPDRPLKPYFNAESLFEDSIRKIHCMPQAFLGRMFTDTEKAISQCVPSPHLFMKNVANVGAVVYNLADAPDIYKYLTTDEIQNLWLARNARFYYLFCNSQECPQVAHLQADAVIANIVECADEAIKPSSRKVAHFRFGHDTIVLPLASLLGLSGQNGQYSAAQVQCLWNCAESICMAANVQMIFFRNKNNHVLVKFFYNEQEVTLPALQDKSVKGCYYPWSDVRQHMLNVVANSPVLDATVKDNELISSFAH